MATVGYLGPQGTFTELAVDALFSEVEKQPFTTIHESMDAVASEEVDVALVPLENAIEGSVNMTLDHLIHKRDLPIAGEIIVPIEQHLLVHPDQAERLAELETVYSHPHAIAQCHDFFREELPEATLASVDSTGAAAAKVAENPDEPIGAVANELAAKQYGLVQVKTQIHDYEKNHTRFVVLARKNHPETLPAYQAPKTGVKTTLMISLPTDYSGALHQVLSAFSWRRLNLSKIESRPMKTGLGNYFFIIDVNHGMDEVLMPGVVAELEALNCSVRILGSYSCHALPSRTETEDEKHAEKTVPES
ncbi:prephenate dehydratase [Salsuginibacillus halophilus]|uniref:Prephenate dehydratase n=1 Tax=Salsuginibacillus halophilus TaxID=517424 RepID=A0A2P8HG11_9BACI|nr:prephenate dehydratase [Salsuginibacillus halophilus]PSL45134.1 prephenate dehydratase [Salsuginibacillus halophilus]